MQHNKGNKKMKPDKEHKPARLYLSFLLGITLIGALYTIAGFWVLPSVLKSQLEKNLSAKFHREVSIESIKVNPYELSFSIKGLAVKELNSTENFLAFDELFGVVQGGSIVARALIMREVRLVGPYANLSLKKDHRFNFSDLLTEEVPTAPGAQPANPEVPTEPLSQTVAKSPSKPSEGKEGEVSPFKLSIHNVTIVNGRLDFWDELKDRRESIRNISLELPLISSLGETKDGWTALTVTAKINECELSMVARARAFSGPLEAVVDMALKQLDLASYQAYLPPQLSFKLNSGLVNANARATYTQSGVNQVLQVTGEVNLNAFEAVDRNDQKLIALPRLGISVESLEPLSRKLHLSKVQVQSPELHLWRNKDGKLNVQTLVAGSGTGEASVAGEGTQPGFRLEVDAIEIANATIGFTDHAVEPQFRTSLDAIDLKVTQFSNAPDSKAVIELSAKTEAKETLDVKGSFSLDPLRYQGTLGVSEIAPAKYAPYYRNQVLFDVIDGRVELKTRVDLETGVKMADVRLSDLTASVSSLKLRKRGETANFLEIPSLQVRESTLNLAGKEATIGEITSEKGMLAPAREKSGELSLQTLVPAAPDLGTGKYLAEGLAATDQSSWKLLLRKVALKDYLVRFEDRMPPEPVTFLVDRINLEGRDFSAEPESKSKVSLSCRVNESGEVYVDGNVIVTPIFADLKLTLKEIPILPVRQYLPEDVKLKPTAGKFGAAGSLLLGRSKENILNVSYTGDLSLSDFSLVDRIREEDFFFCKSLALNGIDAVINPLRANIKKIAINDFFSRVTISPEGNVNVLQVFGSDTQPKAIPEGDQKKGSKTEKKPAVKVASNPEKPVGVHRQEPQAVTSQNAPGPPPSIKIDQVTLQGGEIAFTDNHIKPNFRAELFDIGGTIAGLSTGKDMLADVNLRGKLYRSSPLEITGKISPFPDNLHVDLSVRFKNIDLTRWNPYAQKYIGYTLEKGNLHLELKYVIVKKTLDSQNNIVLDRLTLGEKVDSPEATTLPVKFAVSLLQDTKGEIALGIPVTGNLDDPNFSLGTVILSVLKNLIMKAVSAPFTLLGALLPQGVGEIDRVEMNYASGKITDAGVKKLDAVAKILHDRPNLELDLQSNVDPETGKEILTQSLFETKIKSQKMKELIKRGEVVVSVDQVTVTPDEYEKYLKAAYEEDFSKGGFFKLSFGKKPSPEEMKSQLLTKIQVTDDDLRSLAYDWTLAVKEYLLEAGKVEPRRLFVLEPIIGNPATKTDSKGSGVNLKLK
jgi:uncharacterized protein involved in outer membrane biogenesis